MLKPTVQTCQTNSLLSTKKKREWIPTISILFVEVAGNAFVLSSLLSPAQLLYTPNLVGSFKHLPIANTRFNHKF